MSKYPGLVAAAFGLAILISVIVTVIYHGNWYDAHTGNAPSAIPNAITGLLGLALFLVGCIFAIRQGLRTPADNTVNHS
jgi:hypothetical protein